jgi:hypothetical protein
MISTIASYIQSSNVKSGLFHFTSARSMSKSVSFKPFPDKYKYFNLTLGWSIAVTKLLTPIVSNSLSFRFKYSKLFHYHYKKHYIRRKRNKLQFVIWIRIWSEINWETKTNNIFVHTIQSWKDWLSVKYGAFYFFLKNSNDYTIILLLKHLYYPIFLLSYYRYP